MRKARTPPLAVSDTLLDSLRLMLAESLDHLDANLTGARAGEAEAIHQARVALRRSRSALKLFRRVLSPAACDGFNDALRTMSRTLGDARDWDVFVLESIPRMVEDLPDQCHAVMELMAPAERERERAHQALQEMLDNPDADLMLHELRDWSGGASAFASPKKAARSIEDRAPAMLDRLARRARRRGRALDRQDDEARHELRKSLKSLRYGIEMLEALQAQHDTKPYRRALSGLQEDLGALNDAIAAVELADRLPEGAGRAVVRHWSEMRRRAALAALPATWAQFQATPAFW